MLLSPACDLQKEFVEKHFGIPTITHRMFDDLKTCKACCCQSTTQGGSATNDCIALAKYIGPEGPTRLIKWIVREEDEVVAEKTAIEKIGTKMMTENMYRYRQCLIL